MGGAGEIKKERSNHVAARAHAWESIVPVRIDVMAIESSREYGGRDLVVVKTCGYIVRVQYHGKNGGGKRRKTTSLSAKTSVPCETNVLEGVPTRPTQPTRCCIDVKFPTNNFRLCTSS
uniref:Uncharacterized protein n=1 Tax=Sipha flava TaxID=143950 RepID=A0A2S2QSR8_9HEMI